MMYTIVVLLWTQIYIASPDCSYKKILLLIVLFMRILNITSDLHNHLLLFINHVKRQTIGVLRVSDFPLKIEIDI